MTLSLIDRALVADAKHREEMEVAAKRPIRNGGGEFNQIEAVSKVSGLLNQAVFEGRGNYAHECALLLVVLTNDPDRIPSLLTDDNHTILKAAGVIA